MYHSEGTDGKWSFTHPWHKHYTEATNSFTLQPLHPWGKSLQYSLIGTWVENRANLDIVVKRKILPPAINLTLAIQSITTYFSDWTIPHFWNSVYISKEVLNSYSFPATSCTSSVSKASLKWTQVFKKLPTLLYCANVLIPLPHRHNSFCAPNNIPHSEFQLLLLWTHLFLGVLAPSTYNGKFISVCLSVSILHLWWNLVFGICTKCCQITLILVHWNSK